MDVAAWLRNLGLERYEPLFRDNEIDWQVLPKLTSEDLKEIGVAAIGHRRKLLDALAALDAAPPAAVSAAQGDAPAQADAERRQLTVMFCDLVGSTALATRHDPEDLRELIGDYHGAVGEAVGQFDGFVAKYMGDGVLIYFGYPQAHEDDAERAVRAGLAAIAAVGRLPAREDLRVRLGIATGLAVVGDLIGEGAAQERGVVGEVPNLAARLQALAAPDTLVVAEATRRQIGGLFDLEDLGAQALAGFAAPQRAWRVLGESGAVSRFEALRSGETPLVGREEEVELLLRRWQQAKSGEGRVVLISGEPGIGKSRLTAALSEHIAGEPHTRLRYFCSPHHQDSALYPFIAQLERAAGFTRDDTVDAKFGKFRALVAPGAQDEHDLALLSEVLSLPSAAAEINLSPQRKREKLFGALLNRLEAEARRRPVLMVFEDAHWVDPTSRELLDLTVDRVRHLPVLLAITFRPEFQAPWAGRAHVTSLALNRLGERDGEALVHTLAGNAVLSPDIVAEIVERTDGVPLFVEEMTKAVLESLGKGERVAAVLTTTTQTALSVPATLHASLMARLDRLGPAAREAAQIGAVLGREFSYELIRHVAERPDLDAALTRLTDADLLFCRGIAPQSSYLFKHALVQDAAYSTLLRSRRRQLHAGIARILTQDFGDGAEAQPEILAYHHAQAGEVREAFECWSLAARRSVARSAMAEAAAQYQKGLDQLRLLPDDPQRQRQELEFCCALSAVLNAVKGIQAPETGQAYARARELWEQLGFPSEFLHAPFGQSVFHMLRGEIDQSLRLDDHLLRLSRQRDDAAGLFLGHASSGRNLMYVGRFASSRSHLKDALTLYNPTSHRSVFAVHPQIASQSFLSIALFCLGHPGRALAHGNAAIAEARSLVHPPSLVSSLQLDAMLLSLVGDNAALAERADEVVIVSTEQGFPVWRAVGAIYRGWVAVKNGDVTEGISLLRRGSAAYSATGTLLLMTYYNALLAGACEIAGQIDEAATLLDDALRIVDRTGERWFAAELNRLKGHLLLRYGHREAAEELYRNALCIAREQEAKLWELRAARDLARQWAEQGRRAEAHDLLAPVYGWFTEGFDTADLKGAKALLAELAPDRRVA